MHYYFREIPRNHHKFVLFDPTQMCNPEWPHEWPLIDITGGGPPSTTFQSILPPKYMNELVVWVGGLGPGGLGF